MTNYDSLLKFILAERILSITVICSIITFQFISTFKVNIVDPLLDFVLSEDKFNFLNITIRDGYEVQKFENKKLVLDFGQVFKEFVKWIFIIAILFLLAKYVKIQDNPLGNIAGSAIM
jgi:large-conductance mechanosensitive channel